MVRAWLKPLVHAATPSTPGASGAEIGFGMGDARLAQIAAALPNLTSSASGHKCLASGRCLKHHRRTAS